MEFVVIPSCDFTELFDGISFSLGLLKHVEGYVLDDGDVFGCICFSDTGFIIPKANIQDPMETILNGPMSPERGVDAG